MEKIGYARCSTYSQDLTAQRQTWLALGRSVPDVRAISDQLEAKGVRLALGASIYDPTDPMGKMFFNIVATFAEFEADLPKMRTREGMAIAKAKGKMRGKKLKLTEKQQNELLKMYEAGEHSISDLAEIFSVSRATVFLKGISR